ncbi:hypothetical protein P389DRAFT_1324 [Cystobasidium minutum MCA 4210]|uniref:uncharacterized protein n=1 Tax=Cystobasidium minutum MCA 4210 TaxID=1397322 RepID=UPI0034CF29AF|eukprot:jgi/Rhomi1/1324/CE1323_4774
MRLSSMQTTIAAPLRSAARRSAVASSRASYQVRNASHGPHYNQPSGYLFGEKPGRQKEDWENLYMYGMFGGMALFGVLYLYKPDTTVQTWALAEAKKKLEQEGGMPKWEKS